MRKYINNQDTIQLDNTDKQIIKKLQKNARKSYRQIAEELKLSVGTITNRVQKLEENGIITGFQLETDYQKLDYNVETIIELYTIRYLDNILEQYHDNIITSHKTTGQYDMILITRFKDTTELKQFLENINKEENVTKPTHN